jgi:hypothetical protein
MPERGRWQRLGWFAGLWGASVAVVGLVSLLLRGWLMP